jgi:PiT family inorganic phosphate transporter
VTAAIVILVIALAAANGSNDVPKGVATLAGAGVTRYRTAILWGSLTTLAGSLVSLQFADRLVKLFSKGIVTADPTPAFALAVLGGTAAWVAFATITRLPVSTTHAIVGSLIGAGLLLAAGAVDFGAVVPRVVQPLLLSIGVAYGLSFLLSLLPDRVPECVCVDLVPPAPAAPGLSTPEGASLLSVTPPVPVGLPLPHVSTGSVADCAVHGRTTTGVRRIGLSINGLHWLSSGATSFARGLNDTPKIVAIGAFALVPAGMTTAQILLVVAVAMLAGSLGGGMRVARRLGEGVVRMSHVEGFKANLTTAVLVGLAANRGLPLSTTHVSTGAIAGAAGRDIKRLDTRNLRDFVLAWSVTPLFAGVVAAGLFMLVR